MGNVFIVTLGTREIQFKKKELNNNGFEISDGKRKSISIKNSIESSIIVTENTVYPEYLCLSFPRLAGDTILKYFENYKNIIHFPLIANAIINILEKNKIDQIIFVYTDQKDLDLNDFTQENNFNRDTINFKCILERILSEKFPKLKDVEINNIAIEQKVADIDYQYNFFGKRLQEILPADYIENIFILPQGGIDQINHALTLQLIQAFGNKVHLWQQSESSLTTELKFPHLFLDDLLKQKIVSLIDFGDYRGASSLVPELKNPQRKLQKILKFAYLKKDLLYDEAKKVFCKDEKDIPEIIKGYIQEEIYCSDETLKCFSDDSIIKTYLFQCSERLYLSEYYFYLKDYTGFTLSFSVFLENIIGTYLYSKTSLNILKSYEKNGRKIIENLKTNKPDVIRNIIETINIKKQNKINEIILSFPTLVLIAKYYAEENDDKPMLLIIEFIFHVNGSFNKNKQDIRNFENLRNDIAHKGKGVSENDLLNATDCEKNIEWWENKFMEIKNIFTDKSNAFLVINNFIKSMLN
ncbi:MAG TPA: hypothetical protein PKZ43_02965 [Bacteroidales bacterium]|nr:hypothetical protein [Bacteroidales bacterium]